MQVLVLSGSRNPEGQTARATKAVMKGVTEAGGNTECHFLPEFNIERCRPCNMDGWGICRTEARCIIEDDFPSLVDKIRMSDVVLFATAVYSGDLTESMRAFLDRLRRISFNLRGENQKAQGISVAGLCYSGNSGMYNISACASLEKLLLMCRFDVIDMIPLRRQNLEAKLPILELIGKWLVTKPTS